MKLRFGTILAGVLAAAVPDHASAIVSASAPGQTSLLDSAAYGEARHVAAWIVATKNSAELPFLIIDKVNARLFLFSGAGTLRATTSVLLGMARGDDSPPGIGTRKLSSIRPADRITPAGRFVVHSGEDMDGTPILWIDYDAAVALHRASDRKPGMDSKSRTERLASATPAEKRVSLGCVNVSGVFYDRFIAPTFGTSSGVAYILPETRSAAVEFEMPRRGSAG